MKRYLLMITPVILMSKPLDLPVEYDPFAGAKKLVKKTHRTMIHTKESISQVKLDLIGIFGDKAYINGKFYTIGQNIFGYKLVQIADKFVVLQKGGVKKILPLVEKKILKMDR